MSGEVDLELVCTTALCFFESNNLSLFFSKHIFIESYKIIKLFEAALSPLQADGY